MARFNGFRNKETWSMFTHISNNEELYLYALNLKSNSKQPEEGLKAWFDSQLDLLIKGQTKEDIGMMLLDIGSFWRVDYKEVLDNLK